MSSVASEIAYAVGQAVGEKIEADMAAISLPVRDTQSLARIEATLESINHNVSSFAREKVSLNPVSNAGLRPKTRPQLPAIRAMQGMNTETGKLISGFAHIDQSIADIIKTFIASRCMNRFYGCQWRNYQDFPSSEFYLLKIYATIATAIKANEPRVILRRIHVAYQAPESHDFEQKSRFTFTLEWQLNAAYQCIARRETNNNNNTTQKTEVIA